MMRIGSAIAPSNIAFVKYWGKRDAALNLPAAGSLSMTLSGLTTHTTVSFDRQPGDDELTLNGVRVAPKDLFKVRAVLDAVRAAAKLSAGATVVSVNNFPTGAGLASSASGFAALTVAAADAASVSGDPSLLSRWARLGSGSACRSIVSGFAIWNAGVASDGNDSFATQLVPPEHWPLRMLVAVVDDRPKSESSTLGMQRTAGSSPYFAAWLNTVPGDINQASQAIIDRDFNKLADVAERSCLAMHAAMLTSRPSLLYFRPQTLMLLEELYQLRREGHPLFFTIDAGPNVKVVVPPDADRTVEQRLLELPYIRRLLRTKPGNGAFVTQVHLF